MVTIPSIGLGNCVLFIQKQQKDLEQPQKPLVFAWIGLFCVKIILKGCESNEVPGCEIPWL